MSSSMSKPASSSSSSNDQNQERKKKRGYHDMENPENFWTVPKEDLTIDRLDEFLSLTDRQKICWALQTETRVRFKKVQERDWYNVSTTINDGSYLIDLYPEPVGKGNSIDIDDGDDGGDEKMIKITDKATARDFHDYQRKSRPFLRQSAEVDESWETVTPIIMENYERYPVTVTKPPNYDDDDDDDDDDQDSNNDDENTTTKKDSTKATKNMKNENTWEYQLAPVPPNMLYFRIIMEAYMGYEWFSYFPSDPNIPRGAVMGGAVLAVLTSWSDPYIVEQCKESKLDTYMDSFREEGEYVLPYYRVARKDLVETLNDYFLYDTERPEKVPPFFNGDVDIFLQSSPLTRRLMQHLSGQGLNAVLLRQIGEYVGGLGFVLSDLKAASEKFRSAVVDPLEEHLSLDGQGISGAVYAVANNGLSFQLAVDYGQLEDGLLYDTNYEGSIDDEQIKIRPWPRTTQLIQLRPQADLLGALMDFDLSCVASAFDGQNVYMTPRAAFSVKTQTLTVTPFLIREDSNSRRIEKYWKRGFDAYIVDPYCSRQHQYNIDPRMSTFEKKATPYRLNGVRRRARPIDPDDLESPREVIRFEDHPSYNAPSKHDDRREFIRSIYNFQADRGGGILCCDKNHTNGCRDYSFMIFERSEGHAMEYFERRWSTEWREYVQGLDPRLRMACEICRHEYRMMQVHSHFDISDPNFVCKEIGPTDNFLHEEIASRGWRTGSTKTYDSPWTHYEFYCASTFDSRLAASEGFNMGKALSSLRAKQIMEKVRYLTTNDGFVNPDGYKSRFVYDDNLQYVFYMASNHIFPPPPKPPVGLNPERFMNTCRQCKKWLENCEFHVTTCPDCQVFQMTTVQTKHP